MAFVNHDKAKVVRRISFAARHQALQHGNDNVFACDIDCILANMSQPSCWQELPYTVLPLIAEKSLANYDEGFAAKGCSQGKRTYCLASTAKQRQDAASVSVKRVHARIERFDLQGIQMPVESPSRHRGQTRAIG